MVSISQKEFTENNRTCFFFFFFFFFFVFVFFKFYQRRNDDDSNVLIYANNLQNIRVVHMHVHNKVFSKV